MTTRIIDNPNTPASNILGNLKSIIKQSDENSKYDTHVPSFKSDTIEEFFTIKKYMFDKILIILIICLLALFILKFMDYI